MSDVTLRDLLRLASEAGASDLHLTHGSPPLFRVDGRLTVIKREALPREKIKAMIYDELSEAQRSRFEADKELDCALEIEGLDRFRVNVHIQRGSVEGAFRRILRTIPTPEALLLPPVIRELSRLRNGLVLVSGATGNGKSTTLAAMVNLINAERSCVVTCIEDPIEFVFSNGRSIIKQREVHQDTHSFADALKRCLRQDPDVIVVGEMRDLETIATALTAAETGHLVLATLHTPDAPQTIERIIDVFPPHQQEQVRLQLSSCLQGVVSQLLLPRASGRGRVVMTEVMIATTAVRNMIREKAGEQIRTAMQTGAKHGMRTLDQSLLEACQKGLITEETALGAARNVEDLKAALGKK